VQAVTTYNGLSKELIHRLKFERASAAADDIAGLLMQKIEFPQDVVISYVPTAPARVRTRGYDQAQLIAKAVARRTGLPCVPLLARSSKERQVGKDRATRQQQMKHAFYAPRPQRVAGRRIMLIDDVFTTGSTCQAAAQTLTQAGAEHVEAAVFAVA
jgi:ComF family protein